MRRQKPAFHSLGLGPPASIVVKLDPVHKPEPILISAIFEPRTGPAVPGCNFCYDEGVWQQQAVKNGGVFLRHVIPAILKPLRALWNEVIGFLFLCFAVIFGFQAVRYARAYLAAAQGGGTGEAVRLAIAGFCTLVMAWYGISSFLRARKISRS
jgi:hypothetical protein